MRFFIFAALGCAAVAASFPLRASGAIHTGTLSAEDGTRSFTFSGSSSGGVGSARMEITVTESLGITTVVADIWNTSPTTYGSGQTNVAAITGFGFDVTPNAQFLTYSIVARQWNGSGFVDVVLGNDGSAENLWELVPGGGSGQLDVDLFADNGAGIAEALYNPALAGDPAIGNTQPYFTQAQLIITFAGPLGVEWGYSDLPGYEGNGSYVTPFVRFQRVGDGGSLKLESGGPTLINPEPQSLVIWAVSGAMGLLAVLRRRKAAALATTR